MKKMEAMDTKEQIQSPEIPTGESAGTAKVPETAEKATAERATKAYRKAQGSKKKESARSSRKADVDKKDDKADDGEPQSDEAVRIGELEEKLLRVRAEYDNHIKRTNREKAEFVQYFGSRAFKAILPALDDLNRTINHVKSTEEGANDPMLEGVEMVRDKFVKILEKEGVKPFNSVGEKFDPELHDAMMRRESEEHEEGIVLEEFETGYLYHDRVIRHAKVVVSS